MPGCQDDDADELYFKELRETFRSTALVLVLHFNLPDIKREHHTADTNRSRRFLDLGGAVSQRDREKLEG